MVLPNAMHGETPLSKHNDTPYAGRIFRVLFGALLLVLASTSIGRAASVDETAKGLAGLEAIPGVAAFSGKAFESYAKSVDSYWKRYLDKVQQPMAAWSEEKLPRVRQGAVFYPFSGPDFPTAYTLQPEADRYILISIQRAGNPVDISALKAEDGRKLIDQIGVVWAKFTQLGFFLTEDLDKNAAQPGVRLSPTLILMAFASRLGYSIEDLTPLQLAADGSDVMAADKAGKDWSSIRLTLKKDARTVILDYVRIDLSDENLRRNTLQRIFVETSAYRPTILKAASHLPQRPTFSIIRGAILKSAPFIFQDETGIEYDLLARNYLVQLYGRFKRPNNLFDAQRQKSLAAAYANDKRIEALPFRVGYKKEAGFAVQVAFRRDGDSVYANQLDPPVSVAAVTDKSPPKNPTHATMTVAVDNASVISTLGPAPMAQPSKTKLVANVVTAGPVASAASKLEALEKELGMRLEQYNVRERKLFLSAQSETPAYSGYLQEARKSLAARLGNLRSALSGTPGLIVTVLVQKDGLVRSTEIDRSSGKSDIDKQALALLLGTGRLAPLPSAITQEYDLLGIVLTYPEEGLPRIAGLGKK